MYFVGLIISALAFVNSFSLASVSLWPAPHTLFFEHFFTFWHFEMLQAHLVIFPSPDLETAISSRSFGSIE